MSLHDHRDSYQTEQLQGARHWAQLSPGMISFSLPNVVFSLASLTTEQWRKDRELQCLPLGHILEQWGEMELTVEPVLSPPILLDKGPQEQSLKTPACGWAGPAGTQGNQGRSSCSCGRFSHRLWDCPLDASSGVKTFPKEPL